MKNKFLKISIFLGLLLIAIYHKELFTYHQKLSLTLMKNITRTIKANKTSYFLYFVFAYGMVHSLSPGHGKTYLFNLSLKKSFIKLVGISALIAYGQGVVSFFIAMFFIKSLSQLQSIDILTKNIYGITLILLAIFNLIGEYRNVCVDGSKFVVGVFFPCSGILSVLLLGNLLNKNLPFIYLVLTMSTGVFLALTIFSFIVKNVSLSLNINGKFFEKVNLTINFIILLLGLYMILQ